MNNFRTNVWGMLAGVAYGDALGKITSKYSAEEVIEIYGQKVVDLVKPIKKRSKRKWYKGSITDDTILTLLVSDSIIAKGGFNRRDIAARMMVCDPKGGNQIKKFKDSKDLDYVATTGETDGAAIRVSPLAIISNGSDLSKFVEDVVNLSTITHGTYNSVLSAIVLSRVQNLVLQGLSNEDIFQKLNEEKKVYDHFCLGGGTNGFYERLAEGWKISKEFTGESLSKKVETELGFGSKSIEAVPSSIIMGLNYNDVRKDLISVVNPQYSGGDIDSVASMTASLIGARNPETHNIEAIKVIEVLNNLSFEDYTNQLVEVRNAKYQGSRV